MARILTLGGEPAGFYVDVGGGHPVYDNVSFAFYLAGWRGIVVEPNPALAALTRAVRPRDQLFEGLCGASAGTATLYLQREFHGLSTTVADARFAKPLDTDLLLRLAREHEVLITIEEGSIGGFGAQVLQTLADNGVLDGGLKLRPMVLPDIFIDQDSPAAMYATAGLDAKGIVTKAFEALGQNLRGEAIKLGRV